MMGWGKAAKRPSHEVVQAVMAREVAEASRQRLNRAIAHREKMNQIFIDLLPHHEDKK
jgi:hypothetical protein